VPEEVSDGRREVKAAVRKKREDRERFFEVV